MVKPLAQLTETVIRQQLGPHLDRFVTTNDLVNGVASGEVDRMLSRIVHASGFAQLSYFPFDHSFLNPIKDPYTLLF